MNTPFYENHTLKDPLFPIIFHFDTRFNYNNTRDFVMHWHENIEILYFVLGKGNVAINTDIFEVNKGDIIFINSNSLHYINSITDSCQYYCLIIDKDLCDALDISISDIIIKNIVKDDKAILIFKSIVEEMKEEKAYFKTMVKAISIELLMYLYRNFAFDKNDLIDTNKTKLKMIKSSISYIKNHFKEDISIDDICDNIGFSKYYFCRVFKEITGRTVIDYLNLLRCNNAKKLLISGDYNVSEAAEICGFNNLSYFSKIYKRYMGSLPSSEYKYLSKTKF